MEASFTLKMQAKQLENEARRYQKEANKERNKARAELKKGNRATAQLYAQNATRFEQQAQVLLQQCAATTGHATDLRRAEATAQGAKSMGFATGKMKKITAEMNLEKMSDNRTKLDGMKQIHGAAHDILTQGEGDMEISAAADDLLAALEVENNEFAMMQISDIPQGVPVQAADPAKGYTAH